MVIFGLYWWLYGDNGKDNGKYYLIWGYFWVIKIMEKKMETTVMAYIGCKVLKESAA